MNNVSTPTLITYIIGIILVLNIGTIIALYRKIKKLLPALAYFFLSISNALADDKITEEEWKNIIENAHNVWDIITNTTEILMRKNRATGKFLPPPYIDPRKKKVWSKV